MTPRGLLVAAPRSGAGKTTVALGLVAALVRRGRAVRSVKSGPDYIDTAFHAAATGAPALNLDSWAMTPDLQDALLAEATGGAEFLVVESAMGLFDGLAGQAPRRSGAAADLAARFGLPVLLVLDVSGQSQTAAAVARGFMTHDPAVRLAGVVLNRVASERHRSQVADALALLPLPVLGALPRDAGALLGERHLGLVQACEQADLKERLDRLADLAEQHLDLPAIEAAAAPVARAEVSPRLALPPPGQRIALARDAAFSFVYAHVTEGWRRAGAEIVTFSPLADEAPPEDCDACWLPGGYPELHGARLAAARRFLSGLVRFAETRPVHGECGGYMMLGQGLVDAEGQRHAMAGLLGHSTSFARRKMNLGYRSARLLHDSPLGKAGTQVRGHEFHYSSVIEPGADQPLATLRDGRGQDLGPAGGHRGLVTGTYFHAIAAEG